MTEQHEIIPCTHETRLGTVKCLGTRIHRAVIHISQENVGATDLLIAFRPRFVGNSDGIDRTGCEHHTIGHIGGHLELRLVTGSLQTAFARTPYTPVETVGIDVITGIGINVIEKTDRIGTVAENSFL